MLRSLAGAPCSNCNPMTSRNVWLLLLCLVFALPLVSFGENTERIANTCSIEVTDLTDDFGCGVYGFEAVTQPGLAVASYLWTFGVGQQIESMSSAPNPRHTFVQMGPRKVTLTVVYEDNSVCIEEVIIPIECERCGVPSPINPSFGFLLPGPCSTNAFFSLVPGGGNIQSVLWEFGDGNTQLFTNNFYNYFFYDYLQAGTFRVKVTVTFENGETWECDRFISLSDCNFDDPPCSLEICPNNSIYGSDDYGVAVDCELDFSFLFCPEPKIKNCSETLCNGPTNVFLKYTDPVTGEPAFAGEDLIVTWIENGNDCVADPDAGFSADGFHYLAISQADIDNNTQFTITIQSSNADRTWQCVLCFAAGDLCGGDDERMGSGGQNLLDLPQAKDKLARTQLNVFPNPVNAELNISNDSDQLLIGQLTSLEGKVLNSSNIAAFDQGAIDVSNYPAGIYFFNTFNAQTKSLLKSEKVIIRH
ncbi:MAG: T9SS type A sorting domain-containing protein [Bacteroidota bacterium]